MKCDQYETSASLEISARMAFPLATSPNTDSTASLLLDEETIICKINTLTDMAERLEYHMNAIGGMLKCFHSNKFLPTSLPPSF